MGLPRPVIGILPHNHNPNLLRGRRIQRGKNILPGGINGDPGGLALPQMGSEGLELWASQHGLEHRCPGGTEAEGPRRHGRSGQGSSPCSVSH